MASIKKRTGKNGVSYQITVSAGYDSTGRKMIHTKTWTPEKGMTPRQTEKALQRAAADFERSIELGFQLDNRQTFAEYAGYVLGLKEQEGCKVRTLDRYKELLVRINQAIGHLKLVDIRPQHLNAFYKNLGENGLRKGNGKATAKPALLEKVKTSGKLVVGTEAQYAPYEFKDLNASFAGCDMWLAQQIAEELSNLTYFMPEVQVACVYGGANMEKQAKRLAEGCQIVVATPGRLMDHYKHHSIDISHVTQIVLDEADEMLNMGFYKDVRHIIEMMKARKALSMFSATISREVMDIGWLYQHNAEEITVQPKEESQPKITQYMLETSGRNKLSDLAQIIIGEGYKRVMVFCDTKFNTATLANQLARLGFSVDCLHGDLSQKERNQIMQNFRDGKLAILVATDVAARGIDVSDVDAVINYDVPSDNEHYTHRIGRTGRAKKEGVSYLFYVPEEKKRVQELLRLTRNTDLCTPVHFDFNHEHIVVEEKKDSADRFQIKCYF